MSTPRLLSPRQRSTLAGIASQAWRMLDAKGAIDEPQTAWRHREARDACGFTISEAPAAMFDALAVHFFNLSGQTEKALKLALEPIPNDVRQVIFRIQQERSRQGLAPGYVKGICQNMYGKPEPQEIGEARGILFALIRRRQRERRK